MAALDLAPRVSVCVHAKALIVLMSRTGSTRVSKHGNAGDQALLFRGGENSGASIGGDKN
jgi:hypothetical protein